MIAPIKRSTTPTRSRGIRHARQLVASTLLTQPTRRRDRALPVPAWRAWLFTAWIVVATASYLAHMAGLF